MTTRRAGRSRMKIGLSMLAAIVSLLGTQQVAASGVLSQGIAGAAAHGG